MACTQKPKTPLAPLCSSTEHGFLTRMCQIQNNSWTRLDHSESNLIVTPMDASATLFIGLPIPFCLSELRFLEGGHIELEFDFRWKRPRSRGQRVECPERPGPGEAFPAVPPRGEAERERG